MRLKNSGLIVPLYLTISMIGLHVTGQPLNQKKQFTRQDTLRGTITSERDWWNVLSYSIWVEPDYTNKSIRGWNKISFEAVKPGKNKIMQIDLQEPMKIDSVVFNSKRLSGIKREGNVYWLDFGHHDFSKEPGSQQTQPEIKIYFRGIPRPAVSPPWDGGWIWAKDAKGRPWMTVACQGLGASVWFPCKDHQSDEPDKGAIIQVKVPDVLVGVSNGKLLSKKELSDGTIIYTWQVKNPINSYNIVPYIGKYVSWTDSFTSETGKVIPIEYWVMDYNLETAKRQFGRDVKPMLKCFEYWMGPYPFPEDGFKLVESSHLGMEHQSAIAYGNKYQDGYMGMDLSESGWGKDWDYIIIHESGHEWFANNISTNDIADMWVHEGFTMYSEVLFVECQYGKKAADEYCQGVRRNISNDIPIIGPYGVNQEGSGDMYSKGANLIHIIRQLINDDSLFRSIIRGLNKDFHLKTVDSKDVETYISKKAGKDFSKIFDQYLRTIKLPVLEYRFQGDNLYYRWTNVVDGFDLPVRLEGSGEWIKPTSDWQTAAATAALMKSGLNIDKNFYIVVRKVN